MADERIYIKTELEAIKEGLNHYFPFELGLVSQRIIVDDPWTDSNKIFKWEGLSHFQKILVKATKIDGFSVENIKTASSTLESLELIAPDAPIFKEAEASPVSDNMPSETISPENIIKAEKEIKQRKDLKIKIGNEEDARIARLLEIQALKKGKKVDLKSPSIRNQAKFPEDKVISEVKTPTLPLSKYSTDAVKDITKPDEVDNSIFLGNLPPEELKKKADGDGIVRNIRDAFEREQLIESLKQEATTPSTPAVETSTQTPTPIIDTQQAEDIIPQVVPTFIPKIEEPEHQTIEPSVNVFTTPTPPSTMESTEQEVLPDRGESQIEIPEPAIDKTLIGIPAIPITNEPTNDFKQPEISETPIIIPAIEQSTTPTSVEESITPVDNFFAKTGEKVVIGPEFLAEVEPVREEKQTENTYNQTAPPPIVVSPPQTNTPTLDEALASISPEVTPDQPTSPLVPATFAAVASTIVPDQTKSETTLENLYKSDFSTPVQKVESISESDFSAPPTISPSFVTEETTPTENFSPEVTPSTISADNQTYNEPTDSASITPLMGSVGIASAVIPEPTETEISSQKEPNQAQIYKDTHIDDVSASPVREEIVSKSPEQINVPINTPTINQVQDISPTVDNTPTTTYVGPIAVTTAVVPETTEQDTPNVLTTSVINQIPDVAPTIDNTPTTTYVGPIAVTSAAVPEPATPYSPAKRFITQAEEFDRKQKSVEVDTLPEKEKPLEGQLFPGQAVTVTKPEAPPQIYTRVDAPSEYIESFTTQPVYIPTTTQTDTQESGLKETRSNKASISEADIERLHIKERMDQINSSIDKKVDAYAREIEEAKSVQNTLLQNSASPKTDTKIYVRVAIPVPAETSDTINSLKEQATASPKKFVEDLSEKFQDQNVVKDLPKAEARMMADQAAYTTFQTVNDNSTLVKAAVINKIVDNQELLDKITTNPNEQAVIKAAATGTVVKSLAENENLKQFIDVKEIGGSLNLSDISVDITDTPQYGYEELSLNRAIYDNVVTHTQSFENQQDSLSDFGRDLSERGVDKARSAVLEKAGGILNRKISALPKDSLASKIYNKDFVQKVLLPRAGLGGISSSWTAVEGNWLGNYLVATGNADIGGWLQGATGWNLGLAEVVVGSSVAFAGGFSYYSTTALAMQYSAGTFATEAFLGGAGTSLASSVGTGLGAESVTGFSGYSMGTFSSSFGYFSGEVVTGAATAGTGAVATGVTVGAGTAEGVGATVITGAVAGQAAIPIPVVGLIIGLVTTLAKKVYDFFNSPKIKEWLKNNKELLLVGGLGILGTAPVLGLTAIGASTATAVAMGGYSFGGFFFGAWAFLRTIGRFFTAPFKGLLVGFGILALLVPIILFIINNSAYVMPQGADLTGFGYGEDGSLAGVGPGGIGSGFGGGTIQNAYIGVTKTVSPPGPFQNPTYNHFVTVTYTVTIVAKKETLTNVSFKDDCIVFTKTGQRSCNTGNAGSPNLTVSVGIPYTFTYSKTFDMSYIDTTVVNTMTVTANVASTTALQTAAASAAIVIGNPPTQCPKNWPIAGRWMITQTPGGGFSHASAEAVDFATVMGTPVRATHSGVAHVIRTSGDYRPVYVAISSVCDGKSFQSWYAHLSAVSVTEGQNVTMGQVVGATGINGPPDGQIHLHYEFRGLPMAAPYVPPITRNCSNNGGACGYTQ